MGMEIPASPPDQASIPAQNRPCIFLVGPPNVGKRSILHKLVAKGDSKGFPISTSGVTCHSWTLDTKYYTADVCIWMARLGDNETLESVKACALSDHCEALILVFDLSNFSSFEVLQEWVSQVELQKFEILLCVGNKADRVPEHFGHREYRKRLQKRGESSSDPHPEFWDYGIQQGDGSSLLSGGGESLEERRQACIEWCTEHGIEYIESCAIDDMFDQCMSVDGDSQGLSRIVGALSAHMWPGMIMKSERKLSDSLPMPHAEDNSSDEDSEIQVEYELLSNGSAEPWDGDEGPWSFYGDVSMGNIIADGVPEGANTTRGANWEQTPQQLQQNDAEPTQLVAPPVGTAGSDDSHLHINGSSSPAVNNPDNDLSGVRNGESESNSSIVDAMPEAEDSDLTVQRPETTHFENGARQQGLDSFNDLEQLMQEMAIMRENARLMPDSHRREMAARLAMRMATIFDEDE